MVLGNYIAPADSDATNGPTFYSWSYATTVLKLEAVPPPEQVERPVLTPRTDEHSERNPHQAKRPVLPNLFLAWRSKALTGGQK